jgi:hypothetical protein
MYVARIRFAFSPLGEAVTSLIVLRARSSGGGAVSRLGSCCEPETSLRSSQRPVVTPRLPETGGG